MEYWAIDFGYICFRLQKLMDDIVELLDELKFEAEDILLENT